MERTAFSRAWDYLSYSPVAKWGAMICAALSAFSFVLLVLVLGLFADLIGVRGRVPEYHDLSESQRQQFQKEWNGLPESTRRDSVEALPAGFSAAELNRLSATADPEPSASGMQALRWKAFVGYVLERRVGGMAAQAYRLRTVANDALPAGTDPDSVPLGFLSLIVRNRTHPVGYLAGWLGRILPWTYQPPLGSNPNLLYLVGLLILAVVIAFLRILFISGMHRWAASATIEAITRLRRMIYHHSNRLGSLTISEEGTAEAVSMFSRHVEAVHDGLYARLTVAIREPLKFILVVAVALFVNLGLGLAVICAALLMWLLSWQVTTFYRRQGKYGARRFDPTWLAPGKRPDDAAGEGLFDGAIQSSPRRAATRGILQGATETLPRRGYLSPPDRFSRHGDRRRVAAPGRLDDSERHVESGRPCAGCRQPGESVVPAGYLAGQAAPAPACQRCGRPPV